MTLVEKISKKKYEEDIAHVWIYNHEGFVMVVARLNSSSFLALSI